MVHGCGEGYVFGIFGRGWFGMGNTARNEHGGPGSNVITRARR